MMKNIFLEKKGAILIELVISIALFAIFSVSAITFLMSGLYAEQKLSEYSYASNLSQEGLEALRIIKNRAWNEVAFHKTALIFNDGWTLAGEGTEAQIGKYKRYLEFIDVYRDDDNIIVPSDFPGAILDRNSIIVNSNIFWESNGKELSFSLNDVFTNWQSNSWVQDSWVGGAGQEIFEDGSMFFESGNLSFSDSLSLEEIATSTYSNYGYLISSSYGPVNQGVFSVLSWEEILPSSCSECSVGVQIKTASDVNGAPSDWSDTWTGPEGEDGDEDDYFSNTNGNLISIDSNGDKWIKYKIVLQGSGFETPVLNSINIFYK